MPPVVRPRNRRGLAIVLTFLAGGGLALIGVRASGRWKSGRAPGGAEATEQDDEASARNGGDDLESLRRRLARVEKTEQSRGETAGAELAKSADEAARVAAQTALKAKIDKYYTPALEAKRFDTYFGQLDQLRRAEGVDVAWAQDSEAALRNAVHQGGADLAKLSVASVECGRTLCRVELKSSDPAGKMAVNQWIKNVGGQLPEASVFIPPDGDHMTAYLARPGTSLPEMESLEHLVADLP